MTDHNLTDEFRKAADIEANTPITTPTLEAAARAAAVHVRNRYDWNGRYDELGDEFISACVGDILHHVAPVLAAKDAEIQKLNDAIDHLLKGASQRGKEISGLNRLYNAKIMELLKQDAEIRALKQRVAELVQGLCHNLPESDYKPFCDGCDEYQKKLFGKCRTEELERKILDMILEEANRDPCSGPDL